MNASQYYTERTGLRRKYAKLSIGDDVLLSTTNPSGVVTSHVGKPLNFIIYAPNTGNLSFCLPFRVTAIVSCQRALLAVYRPFLIQYLYSLGRHLKPSTLDLVFHLYELITHL